MFYHFIYIFPKIVYYFKVFRSVVQPVLLMPCDNIGARYSRIECTTLLCSILFLDFTALMLGIIFARFCANLPV